MMWATSVYTCDIIDGCCFRLANPCCYFLLPLTSPKSKCPLVPLASAASCPAIGAATDCCPGVACAGREVGGAGGPLATPGDGGGNGCRRVFCTGKERGCGGRAFRMTVPHCPPGLHFVRRCGSKGFFSSQSQTLASGPPEGPGNTTSCCTLALGHRWMGRFARTQGGPQLIHRRLAGWPGQGQQG